jgi:hypothetical protein
MGKAVSMGIVPTGVFLGRQSIWLDYFRRDLIACGGSSRPIGRRDWGG